VGARYTQALERLHRADARLYGGKSAGLGELIASELPVPGGFAISSDAYRDAAEATGDGGGAEAPPLPPALRAEIGWRYGELAAAAEQDALPVAVRSSALGEDAEGASFAGQHGTFLGVRGADAVCEAVRDCWASLFNPEAVSYRERMSAHDQTPAMGVTVQRMVDAAVSGVMFTCNPVSGDPSTVAVNASWGLGLAVVSGEVNPDEYRISKVTKEVLHRAVGDKQIEFLPDPAGSGTVRAEVAGERRTAACLTDEQLAELTELARRVERHFGGHQDIEWAIARDDRSLFLLQSRPVTAASAKDRDPPKGRSAIDLVMGTFGASDDPR
jgi:pyruvate, water dikinase